MLRSIVSLAATSALLLTATPAVSATEAQPQAKRPAVSLKLNNTVFTGGQRVRVSGKVSTERGVQRKVVLQARVNGRWGDLTTRRTTRKGVYSFRFASPNPASREAVAVRVKVQRVKSAKVRKAWRGAGLSKPARVAFRNNPAIVPPTYSLALPPTCVTETPGVMAKTAACVAAMEVQSLERWWRDGDRMERILASPTRTLQFAFDLGGEPTTPAEEYEDVRLIAPYTTEVLPEEIFTSSPGSPEVMMFMMALFTSMLDSLIDGLFGDGATDGGTWRPEWTRKFLLMDLSRVRIDGNTATLPERKFVARVKDGKVTLTMGGTYTYRDGLWVGESPQGAGAGARLSGRAWHLSR